MYLKKILLLFFLILLSNEVLAVGIGKYDNTRTILFTPNAERTMSYYLFDAGNIGCRVEGELSEYATIMDPNPNGGARNIDIKFKFPEYLDPGYHTIYIVATQSGSTEGAVVGGIASVRVPLNIFVLYPGKKPEIQGLSATDTNVNQSTQMSISLTNNGEETIDSINADIEIYDESENLITTIKTNSGTIKSFETLTLTSALDTSKYSMPTGSYKAVAKVFFDGKEIDHTAQTIFIVGKLSINILDTTREVIVNATNKYYIVIESDWTGNIDNVYARINMPNGEVIKTPNIDIVKNEQGTKARATIEAYMETDNIALGTYDVPITLYFKGQSSQSTVKLNIIEGIAPDIKKPNIFDNKDLMIVSAAIILGIIIYMFVRKKNNGGNSSGPKPLSASTTDIKPPTL